MTEASGKRGIRLPRQENETMIGMGRKYFPIPRDQKFEGHLYWKFAEKLLLPYLGYNYCFRLTRIALALEVKSEGSQTLRYDGHLESKERFAIKKYLLIIGKKKNMQVLSHTFTYFST